MDAKRNMVIVICLALTVFWISINTMARRYFNEVSKQASTPAIEFKSQLGLLPKNDPKIAEAFIQRFQNKSENPYDTSNRYYKEYTPYKTKIKNLLYKMQFVEIEKEFQSILEEPRLPISGVYKDKLFLEAIDEEAKRYDETYPGEFERGVLEWKKTSQYPIVPTLLLANYYFERGWGSRGDGSAPTITKSGARSFRKDAKTANAYIIEAEKQSPNLMPLLMLKMKFLTATSKPKVLSNRLFAQMIKIDAKRPDAYYMMLMKLLPRWSGSYPEICSYIKWVYENTKSHSAEKLYALLALKIPHDGVRPTEFFEKYELSWPLVQKGILQLDEERALDFEMLDNSAWLACQANDLPAAASIFKLLARDDYAGNWLDWQYYNRCRNAALAK